MTDSYGSTRPPTECPLCFETYTMEGGQQPRMIIQCGHTVCFDCISKLASSHSMVCPICRKRCSSRLINETGFPINYLAITLIENQKKSGTKKLPRQGSETYQTSPKPNRKQKPKTAAGNNECSECSKIVPKLIYCFHCASPVCEDCKTNHAENVLNEVEKQTQILNDLKSCLVKKHEELQKVLGDLESNCQEIESEIDDVYTIISHEVVESKSKLLTNLNEKYIDEKNRIQNLCTTITDSLEDAENEDLPEVSDKNAAEIASTEVAALCESAMNIEVISSALAKTSKQTRMHYLLLSFCDQDQLKTVRNMVQLFGKIKTTKRYASSEYWNEEDEDSDDANSGAIGVTSDDNPSEFSYNERSRVSRRSSLDVSMGNEYTLSESDSDAEYNTRTFSSKVKKAQSFKSGSAIKAKVKNKLSNAYNTASLRKSYSLSRLENSTFSDNEGNTSFRGDGKNEKYGSLRAKYEAIRRPVANLIYRDNGKSSTVLDVTSRYRSSAIVVVDNNEYRLKVYSASHRLMNSFNFRLSNEESIPFISGVAVTSDKVFLLVDSKNKYLRQFDRKGHHIQDIGKDMFQRPKDVCTDDVEIFVTDSGGSSIYVFDMQGIYQRTLGSPGSGEGEFLWPAGMQLTSEGKIVVCDVNNNRIQVITKDGEHVSTISCIYGAYTALKPTSVDIDKDNNIIALFSESRRIKIFTKDGNPINDFRVDFELASLAVLSDGLIVVIDGTKDGRCYFY